MLEGYNPLFIASVDFSLPRALERSCAEEQEDDDVLGLFNNSPLSSASTSRSPTPSHARGTSPPPPSLSIESTSTFQLSHPPHPRPTFATTRRKRPSKVAKDKKRDKKRRQQASKQADVAMRAELRAKHVAAADPLLTHLVTDSLGVAATGFTGLLSKTPQALRRRPVLFKTLSGPGADLRLVKCRDDRPIPLIDSAGRVIGVSIAPSREHSFLAALARITQVIEGARSRGRFSAGASEHARGSFPTLSSGYSHGGGRKMPTNMNRRSDPNYELVEDIVADPAFKRLAGFVDRGFETWAPRLHAEYARNMAALQAWNKDLKQNWENSVYASWVCNLGPQTVCYRHHDAANLPYGLCAITSFGSYDFTRGGHIVLWNLGIALEHPPWRTIYILSSPIEHSNVSIGPGETRYSTTQYTAGALFRFVERGMRGAAEFVATSSKEDLEASALRDAKRWQFGLSLFSTLEELRGRK
ncbi:hypothetical protein H0H92_004110 [Tricholoma furcatifolium]|nr:hypothetical protein H0H92_004110 [Tricholoma furcatifolium]